MANTNSAALLARIERALDRIEAAAAQAPSAAAHRRLEQAHTLLRTRVEGAIGEIDRLLARPQGGS